VISHDKKRGQIQDLFAFFLLQFIERSLSLDIFYSQLECCADVLSLNSVAINNFNSATNNHEKHLNAAQSLFADERVKSRA
jgi:hypothetical protein